MTTTTNIAMLGEICYREPLEKETKEEATLLTACEAIKYITKCERRQKFISLYSSCLDLLLLWLLLLSSSGLVITCLFSTLPSHSG